MYPSNWKKVRGLAALLMVAGFAPVAQAAVFGTPVTYQGLLQDGGVNVNGDVDFEFRLFDDELVGNQVGNTHISTETVTDGLFTAIVDFGVDPYTSAQALWIEVNVEGQALARQMITGAPYSLATRGMEVASNGIATFGNDGIGTAPLGSTVQVSSPSNAIGLILRAGDGAGGSVQRWDMAVFGTDSLRIREGEQLTIQDRLVIKTGGNVGIGTTTPASKLDVAGNIHASGTIASGNTITIDGTGGSESISSSGSLDLRIAGGRAFRLESNVSPNLIGGFSGNSVTTNMFGATIGGGGAAGQINQVTNFFGTVSGGEGNVAGGENSTVSGGFQNTASGLRSIVGGGSLNISSGIRSTIGGGFDNTASASQSTVGGGSTNTAGGQMSTIGGGGDNLAGANFATVPGGNLNQAGGEYSLAAGRRAKVRDAAASGDSDGDQGTFVWADATNADFTSTGPNQFLIRADGGVGIGTATPTTALEVRDPSVVGWPVKITSNANAGFNLDTDGTSSSWGIFHDSGDFLVFRDTTTGANRMFIDGGSGAVTVVGTLSKGGGSFRIDHPLDPENKELFHSFVESPDMMNIYNGNARTDGEGYATITLPDYFEALNRDFRYQLTVLDDADGEEFTLAKVVKTIEGNQFTIRTSAPRTEVSWQVTGVRHDAWAEANRIPTVVEKRLGEKGKYLHPEAWGLSDEKGVFWSGPENVEAATR